MDSKELLAYFLPEGILEYFEIREVKESKDRLTLILEEKPLPTVEQSQKRLHSKGFYPIVQIQDFSIRRKACYLEVKRRRWINIFRNILLVISGSNKYFTFIATLKNAYNKKRNIKDKATEKDIKKITPPQLIFCNGRKSYI